MSFHLRRRRHGDIEIGDQVRVVWRGRRGAKIKVRPPKLWGDEPTQGDRIDWLKCHRDHVGVDCLIYPWAVAGKATAQWVVFNFRRMRPSRAMCYLVHGRPPEDGMQAIHSCGNGHLNCVHPEHVSWGTPAQNGSDTARHGSLKGERHPQAKLTDAQVLGMWRDLKRGRPVADLAAEFGISEASVCGIRDGHSWAWLTRGGGREVYRKPDANVPGCQKAGETIRRHQVKMHRRGSDGKRHCGRTD